MKEDLKLERFTHPIVSKYLPLHAILEDMKVGILIIGDEILSGETLDTNSRFAAKLLNDHGFNVINRITVGDREKEITDGLEYLLKEADIVISCGGMGPTKDDITKKTLANYFGSELIWDAKVEEELRSRYERMGRVLNELTLQQAMVPAKAEVIINPVGTAPVFWFQKNNKAVITLPGVPIEMRHLMEHIILQKLKEKFVSDFICHETIRTVGIAESLLAKKLSIIEEEIEKSCTSEHYFKLAYLPELAMVKLRISGIGKDQNLIQKKVLGWKSEIIPLIEEYIYGYGNEELAESIGKTLQLKNATLATAESCTGGYLAHLFTSVPGSSVYYKGSVITYAYEFKEDLLGVKNETLNTFGAVSEETCREMIAGALSRLKTDYVITTTGIAGPGGGTPDKPVGMVWIGVGNKNKIITKKYYFNRNRIENIHLFAITALDMLRKMLKEE